MSKPKASAKRPDALRAVAYVRVSKERDGMISPELQMASIKDHCDKMGYTIVETLEDLDLSGRFWERRSVDAAVRMIERREADVLVVWKISRVSRNMKDWVLALDRVEGAGGHIESATEQFDRTSTGGFARGMMAQFADFESKRIGDSWKETHARRIRNGLPHHGLPRFGYTYDKTTGYTPCPEQGPVLAEMYRRYAAGATLREIAAYTGAEGFEPEGGWFLGTLGRTLDHGFGAGYIWTKGELVRGAHEPVVSEAVWDEFLVRRGVRNSRPRAEASDYTYSGLLHCHCGARMAGAPTGKGGRRYVCNMAVQQRTHKIASVAESKVERVVLGWLETIREELEIATRKKMAVPAPRPKSSPAERIKRDLLKNQMRLDTLTLKHLDGDIGQEVYARLVAQLEAEKATLEGQERAAKVIAATPPSAVVPGLLKAWDSLPERGKRETLQRLVAKIQLHDWKDGERDIKITPVWQ